MKRNATCFASFSLVFVKQTHHFFRFFSHGFASIFFAISLRHFRFITKNHFFRYFASSFSLQNTLFASLLRRFCYKTRFSQFRSVFFTSKHFFRYFASFLLLQNVFSLFLFHLSASKYFFRYFASTFLLQSTFCCCFAIR
jgi:hypothetical protein